MSNVHYQMRYASHPDDAKHYDTDRLREEYLFANILTPGEINLIYSAYDRMIVGGAVPGVGVGGALTLEAIAPLRAAFFLERRELGIINVGGPGIVGVGTGVGVGMGGETFALNYKEALYLGRGDRNVVFESTDAKNPAKFYFNSAPAHTTYPDKKVTKAEANVLEMGTLQECNQRTINRLIVSQVLPTCQLQMGMTELKEGSVWNTMPAHTHERRMEAYFYFELPENQMVCHFMGQPHQTRHIWMGGDQAVISPQWSIHSACATHNYTFIWGMAGENLDYGDMDGCDTVGLK